MKTHPKDNEALGWSADWEVGVRVWVERHGDAVLGEGRADLLAAIDRTHSISAAARLLGISYRHAWTLVQKTNEAAGEPLVTAATGGLKGGGAQLTPRGKFALGVFAELRDEVRSSAAALLQRTLARPTDENATVHLAAAISAQEVVGQLLTEYALRQPGVAVRAVFGASNELADHILAGAPCDLFLSADADHIERLAAVGSIAPGQRRVIATNRVVAIGNHEVHNRVRKPADLLQAFVKHVAVADPACPLGKHSHAWLRTIECASDLAPKIVQVDNSRGVLAAMASGRAQVGVAFASDAAHAQDYPVLFAIAPSGDALSYSAAVVQRGRRAEDAARLLDFFSSQVAQRCFRRCGFALPK
jgi:molybdenum ABC transporter molybdate-binding protein